MTYSDISNALPKTLFKYRRWDAYGKKTINDNELYFSSTEDFNDPFEGAVPLRYELGTDKQLEGMAREQLEALTPPIPEKAFNTILEGLADEMRDPNRLNIFKAYHKARNAKSYGVCALTEDKENIVMWSHYSADHTGYCVGLDTEKLMTLKDSKQAREVLFDLVKVQYKNSMPDLNPFELSVEELSILPLSIKSLNWLYEMEYRLISLTGPNQVLKLGDGIISEVIIGCRMGDPHKQELLEIAKSKGWPVRIMQASAKEDSFGLAFVEIV